MSLGLSGCFSSDTVTSIKASLSATAHPELGPLPSNSNGFSLQAQSTTLTLNQETALIVTGGTLPYTFAILSGGGDISGGNNSITGFYRAARAPGITRIEVQDALGKLAYTDITILASSPKTPNDSLFSNQAHYGQIGSSNAWGIETDCTSTLVAVIDTGVSLNHPDLKTNIWTNTGEVAGNNKDDDGNGVIDDIQGWNFSSGGAGNNNIIDDNFHGTHVSGLIGAVSNNASGVTGVCWKASILPVKALNSSGQGTLSQLISGIGYAVATKAKVINVSLGLPAGANITQTELSSLTNAVTAAQNAGIILVAAAGNESNNNDTTAAYPASLPLNNVVSVAAITGANTLAAFSNYGPNSVKIAAPGVSILSTFPETQTSGLQSANAQRLLNNLSPYNTSYQAISGTSMSTPLVTGALALLWSVEPNFTYQQIIARLYSSADTVTSLQAQVQGGRKLNVGRMLYPGFP